VDIESGDLTFIIAGDMSGTAQITLAIATVDGDATLAPEQTFLITLHSMLDEEDEALLAGDAPTVTVPVNDDGSPQLGGCVLGGSKGMPWLGGLVLLALAAGVCVRRRANA
jgi:hypothetical protein